MQHCLDCAGKVKLEKVCGRGKNSEAEMIVVIEEKCFGGKKERVLGARRPLREN